MSCNSRVRCTRKSGTAVQYRRLPAGCSQSGLKPRGTTLSAAETTALQTTDMVARGRQLARRTKIGRLLVDGGGGLRSLYELDVPSGQGQRKSANDEQRSQPARKLRPDLKAQATDTNFENCQSRCDQQNKMMIKPQTYTIYIYIYYICLWIKHGDTTLSDKRSALWISRGHGFR